MKLKSGRGFTLVEILVVISITLILSAVAFTYNRSSERQIILFKEQAVVVGLLNHAKSLAFQKYRDPVAADSDFVGCAFGVHIKPDSKEVILFQDLGLSDCGAETVDYTFSESSPESLDPGISEELERIMIDSRVEFVNIPPDGLDILFIPPDVDVISTVGLPTSITLQTIDGKFNATITVSVGGQISTE